MAGRTGAFPKFEENREAMLRVMRNHRLAAYDADEYERLEIKPQGIKAKYCPDYLLKAATKAWDDAVQLGEKYGYRNAQSTVSHQPEPSAWSWIAIPPVLNRILHW